MDADRALKKLFKLRATDLLPVTGDRGAEGAVAAGPGAQRRDAKARFRAEAEAGDEVYLRHLEFEMKLRKGLALRVFEYAAALAAEHGLPVASTVMIVRGRPSSLVHEERVGGRVVLPRRISVVRCGGWIRRRP